MDKIIYNYVIAAFVVTIFYIAMCNVVSAILAYKVLRKLGWGPASKLLTLGFAGSAFAWLAFSSANEVLIDLDSTIRMELVLAGLIVKSLGMTAIVIGFHTLYKVTSNMFAQITPSTHRVAVIVDTELAPELGVDVAALKEIDTANADRNKQQPPTGL